MKPSSIQILRGEHVMLSWERFEQLLKMAQPAFLTWPSSLLQDLYDEQVATLGPEETARWLEEMGRELSPEEEAAREALQALRDAPSREDRARAWKPEAPAAKAEALLALGEAGAEEALQELWSSEAFASVLKQMSAGELRHLMLCLGRRIAGVWDGVPQAR